MRKIILKVEGMTCSHCEMTIQDALRRLPGIKKAKANRRKKEVQIVFNDSPARNEAASNDLPATNEAAIRAINDTGYRVCL
jgi:copper chaperone CopZ